MGHGWAILPCSWARPLSEISHDWFLALQYSPHTKLGAWALITMFTDAKTVLIDNEDKVENAMHIFTLCLYFHTSCINIISQVGSHFTGWCISKFCSWWFSRVPYNNSAAVIVPLATIVRQYTEKLCLSAMNPQLKQSHNREDSHWVDTLEPSMEMPFSLHLPFLLSVSWLSLRHDLPPPQGHYTVIAPARGPTCVAIVVSAHLVACNAPMKSVMKQVGSPATSTYCLPLGQHLGGFLWKLN